MGAIEKIKEGVLPASVVSELLRPISSQSSAGHSIRSESLFTEIRFARDEDDPNLPMGDWARPLKKADWEFIECNCAAVIKLQSKDFQLAAWLTEAWIHSGQLEGARNGLALIHGLIEQFWEDAFPVIEEGDVDARVAVFEWINDTLARTLRYRMTFVDLIDQKPSSISWGDWDALSQKELIASSNTEESERAREGRAALTRALVLKNVRDYSVEDLKKRRSLATECDELVGLINTALDEKLGADRPSLGRLRETFSDFIRIYESMIPVVERSVPVEPPENKASAVIARTPTSLKGILSMSSNTHPNQVDSATWSTRAEAYETLERLADYLGAIEPHSPTPYLIRRAVSWGKMPLPQLMNEILREGGDLHGMMNMLGLQRDDVPRYDEE